MKSIEIVAADSLEETLSCDDLFLEYFNVYLSLPAFPQRLCYSRFTGTFHDINKETVPVAQIRQEDDKITETTDSNVNATLARRVNSGGVGSKTSVYAAREDERERVIKWAREHRLSFFQETEMYRELKLCKLLLRPLDLRRGSSRIRGYSRLSMGFATTTSLVSGTGRNDSPSQVLTSLDNQSNGDWPEINSTKYVAASESRPSSRAFSLPPTLGLERTWSAKVLYETSVTNASGAIPNNDVNTVRDLTRPTTHKRRHPITSSASRQQDQSRASRTHMYSDSGLGTTALDYAQSVGTSVKTRNVLTRADTLGVSSRWDSEEEYGADSRARTAMTSSTVSGEEYLAPASASAWKSKYEGKSAMRTADSPSKPHRATIVLPKMKSTYPVVRIVAGSSTDNGTTISTSETKQDDADDDATCNETNEDDLDDEFDDEVGEFLDFDDRESSCEETETEIASIEKVHSMSMQHIKERIFRTKSGMDSFLRFLQGTAGKHLVAFWLDTEAFKDSLTRYEERGCLTPHFNNSSEQSELGKDTETSLRLRRHRLFRNILDRHKFILTEEAREQIRLAQANEGMSHRVFSRTQYDVLRRLRSYWLPRFVIHKDADPTFKQRLASGKWDEDDVFVYNPPVNDKAISTLPVFSLGYVNFSDESTSNQPHLSVQTLESATAQMVDVTAARPTTSQIRTMSARSASFHSVMRALMAEAEAGFPFRNYLKKKENREILNSYDFLMCLEYLTYLSARKSLHKTSSEKPGVNLDGAEAYSLYTTFLTKDSPCNLKVPKKLSLASLEQALKRVTAVRTKRSTISLSLFRQVKNFSMSILSGCLKKYQQYEISNYYEYREGKPHEFSPEPQENVMPSSKTSVRADESSTTQSETTSGVSKPWFTDDDTTETDSASTMYSYDVERLRQLAQSIRQKGAKKPQRTPPKKAPLKKKFLKRGTTAIKAHQQASKVQFNLPEDQRENVEEGIEQTVEDDDFDEEDGSEEEKKTKKKKKSKLFQHPNRMTFSEIKENKLLYTFFRKYVQQCESVEIQNVMQMYQLCDAIMMIPTNETNRKHVLSAELVKTFLHQTGPKQIAMPSERTAQFYGELPTPSDESIHTLQDYVASTLDQAAANFSLGFGTQLKEYKLTLKSDLGQHMNKAELALRTLTLKPSSKRRKALGKHSARQTPTSEHKIMFMEALDRAKEGGLPVDLIHFFKYLQGFGPQEGYPLIHNDLLFYVEVSKFVASYHEDYDLVTLKRKIMSIRDCFIDSHMEKSLQIDIKTGTAERLRRAMDAFLLDRGREPHVSTLFDDAQHTVFNELLPFWAGFVTAMSPSEREGKRPVLKGERMQKRRLEAFKKTADPKVEFAIPNSQPKFDMKGIEFTFSVVGGIQWKAWSDASSSRSNTPPVKGIIEVVKAPPTGQRRIVRRSGFTIRKLQTSRTSPTKPAFPASSTVNTVAKKATKEMNFTAAAKSLTTNHIAEKNLTYATSVC